MGRPTKFTPAVRAQILNYLRMGNTRETAAEAAGIDRTTLFLWMKKGQHAQRGDFFDFFNLVKKAEAEAVALTVGRIRDAGKESWQANAWWLERRYPQQWGQKLRLDLSREVDALVSKLKEQEGLEDDEAREIAEEAMVWLRERQ